MTTNDSQKLKTSDMATVRLTVGEWVRLLVAIAVTLSTISWRVSSLVGEVHKDIAEVRSSVATIQVQEAAEHARTSGDLDEVSKELRYLRSRLDFSPRPAGSSPSVSPPAR